MLSISQESLKETPPDNDIIKREKIDHHISGSLDAVVDKVVDKWDLTKWNSYLPDYQLLEI